jgi:hypothetical protein
LCPGSTPLCRRACYARQLERFRPKVRQAYARNLRLSRRRDFARRMTWFIRAHFVRVVRVHVGGDFYSARYARKWLKVMRRLRKVRFYFYTRSWRVPEIWPVLEAMAALPNCFAWFSCDTQTGLPGPLPARVRVAWLQTNQGDVSPGPVDLIFRNHPLRRRPPAMVLPMAGRVCPEQDGVRRAVKPTCERCQSCFRPADAVPRGAALTDTAARPPPGQPPSTSTTLLTRTLTR